ncbi:hypothetical protein [Streptomyces sp. 058-1L]|uniref:hypothetical protein n=1 Tax=Streptomyces sp. 058-1L TaxID=2789266 RepID=UPI0039800A80
MAELARATWSGVTIDSSTPLKPGAFIHFGEGEPLHDQRIPAVALVTGPLYLLAELRGDLVDIDALTRQIDSFRRLLTHLAGPAESSSFGTVELPTKEEKALAGDQVLRFVAAQR